jgi:hypothetical protein
MLYKVIVVIQNLVLRGQPIRKLRDRQLGHFTVKHGTVHRTKALH